MKIGFVGAGQMGMPMERRTVSSAGAVIDEYQFIFPVPSGRAATWVTRVTILHNRALVRVLVVDFLGRTALNELETLIADVDARAKAALG